MQYNLTNTFTSISESSGVFYTRPGERVEIAVGDSPEYTGFILQGGSPLQFSGENIKARAVSGKKATLNVTPSTGGGGGGGGGDEEYATDAEVDEMLDNVFGD
ncbi:hypothetical protein [Selenomonas sp. AE3005]|uniref:hypothetical protein n=1 Tax=Selenomonas sp. AE3005 TaxID=1485543 RepID=UPI0025F5B34D|nr:hypothetical protein [Selenomonas sp. AE3005]